MDLAQLKGYFTQFRLFVLCSLVSMLVGIGIGFALGHWAYAPKPVKEVPKAAVQLPPSSTAPNGGVIAAVVPDSHAKPAQPLPKGYVPLRTGGATVAPKPEANPQTVADKAAVPNCPPIHFDWTLLQATDGTQAFALSSPDGIVTDAVDHPIVSGIYNPSRPYAAGIAYSTNKNIGAWLDRDFGRIRIGTQVNQTTTGNTNQARTLEAWAKLGFTFGG